MTSSQAKSNSKSDTFTTNNQLFNKTMDFGNKALDFGRDIFEIIKSNPILAASVAGAFIVAPSAYTAVSSQSYQPDVGFQALDSDQQVVVNHFIDKTADLLDPQSLDSSNNTLDENVRRSLKSNSFTALRNLDGRGKGRLLRFLAEYELIEAENPEISLAGADLREIDLEDAWLPDVDLRRVYMMNGNLARTNLVRTNLSDASLKGVDFTEANLKDTDFTRANLTGAQFDEEKAKEEGAIFCDAIMPDGERHQC